MGFVVDRFDVLTRWRIRLACLLLSVDGDLDVFHA